MMREVLFQSSVVRMWLWVKPLYLFTAPQDGVTIIQNFSPRKIHELAHAQFEPIAKLHGTFEQPSGCACRDECQC